MRAASISYAALVLLSTALTVACNRVGSEAVLKDIASSPGKGRYIEGVPFHPQEGRMCGPAALASVLGYWGRATDVREISEEVYIERIKGALPIDLLIYAKGAGFEASFYAGGIEDLKEKITGGAPVILLLDLGYWSGYQAGHYIVATGYSDGLKAVIAHSGAEKDKVFSYDSLLGSWGATGFSTLLVRPHGVSRGGPR
jgi:ABC-type bacteriocin/lantibiotic exporter with double-glycine peptidase domain